MPDILVSPGFGAGWSTWADDKYQTFCLTYAPFIEKLNRGESLTEDEDGEQFIRDLGKAFNEEDPHFYLGGLTDLVVAHVDGPFLVHEYDGHESVKTPSSEPWIELENG